MIRRAAGELRRNEEEDEDSDLDSSFFCCPWEILCAFFYSFELTLTNFYSSSHRQVSGAFVGDVHF